MHVSAILVLTDPERIEACRQEVESQVGVEVRHSDPPTGRLIAVLESDTLPEQEDGLRRIQALATVRLAALVEHRVDEAAGRDGPGRDGSPESMPKES